MVAASLVEGFGSFLFHKIVKFDTFGIRGAFSYNFRV